MLGYLYGLLGIDIESMIDDIIEESCRYSYEYFDRIKKIKSKKRKRKGKK